MKQAEKLPKKRYLILLIVPIAFVWTYFFKFIYLLMRGFSNFYIWSERTERRVEQSIEKWLWGDKEK